jgi:hypothetical protein
MKPMFEAFELAAQYRHLAELLAERHDDPQVVADTLESLSGPLDEQLENLAKMVRNLEAADSGVQATIAGLEARHQSLQRAAENGRRLILDLMRGTGRERVTTALFELAVRRNPPHVVVDSEQALPPAFLVARDPVPDKRAIAAALKAGMTVPGVHTEQGTRLDIH